MSASVGAEVAAEAVVEPATADKKPSQYYYWHGHEKERAKLGDVAPKPTPMLVKSEAAEASPLLRQVAITKYSWCNNTSSVSVYVDFDGVTAENCVVEYAAKKAKVVVHPAGSGTGHVLVLHLAKEIDHEKSSFRFKPNQLVCKLVKKDDATWYDLIDNKATADDE